jgi:hypothetical protein
MVLRNLSGVKDSEVRFSIKTSTAVAGVRETCFLVKVEDDNDTYILKYRQQEDTPLL